MTTGAGPICHGGHANSVIVGLQQFPCARQEPTVLGCKGLKGRDLADGSREVKPVDLFYLAICNLHQRAILGGSEAAKERCRTVTLDKICVEQLLRVRDHRVVEGRAEVFEARLNQLQTRRWRQIGLLVHASQKSVEIGTERQKHILILPQHIVRTLYLQSVCAKVELHQAIVSILLMSVRGEHRSNGQKSSTDGEYSRNKGLPFSQRIVKRRDASDRYSQGHAHQRGSCQIYGRQPVRLLHHSSPAFVERSEWSRFSAITMLGEGSKAGAA